MTEANRREEKKLQTMHGIVAAAASLFADRGFDKTKIEDIADMAEVSPGTVYNYFGTKRAILTAVASVGWERAISRASGSLDLSAEHPADVLMPVIDVYMEHVGGLGKDLLKEVMRAGFDPAASDVLSELVSLDEQAVAQIAISLGRMQADGMIRQDINVGQASMFVYSVVGAATLWYVSVPEIPINAATDMIRSQLGLVFDGIAVR
jgi:AcrR family transcriptional regulator